MAIFKSILPKELMFSLRYSQSPQDIKPFNTPQAVVFLDRDGTLHSDTGYLYQWADVEWVPNLIEALFFDSKKRL